MNGFNIKVLISNLFIMMYFDTFIFQNFQYNTWCIFLVMLFKRTISTTQKKPNALALLLTLPHHHFQQTHDPILSHHKCVP